MRSRHSLILILGLGLALPAAAQTPPTDPGQARAETVCTTQADRNNLTGSGRETFLRECLAGERLDQPKPDASKP